MLADLTYNVMRAQRAAYDIDRDIQRLRTAKHLLDRSIGIYEAAQADASTLEDLRKEREELAAQIEAAESEAAAGDDTPPPKQEQPVTDAPGARPGRPLIIAGSVAAGLGVAGLGTMGAGMAMGNSSEATLSEDGLELEAQRDAIDRGLFANKLALAGGIAGGVLGATGAVLIVLGLKKNRSAQDAHLQLAPMLGQRVGLQLGGRF